MEHIRQAIERAKVAQAAAPQPQGPLASPLLQSQGGQASRDASIAQSRTVSLNPAHLESKRIVSHDIGDARSKSFDMLRTQVLQSMDLKSWQLLAVTSPTAACGKTTISVNLALSIARQPHRSVLLVDMDLQRPEVANTLGLKCDRGLVTVLEGKAGLHDVLIQAHVGQENFLVLPCANSTPKSSAWMASQAMAALLQQIKQDFRAWTVILDLPPVLTSDDVISILPQVDSVLFVAAAGATTLAEIKECNRHLQAASIVRVVLNKSADTTTKYYSRYAYGSRTQVKASA
jgi:capsular exopolysaccharide synthesis family protein